MQYLITFARQMQKKSSILKVLYLRNLNQFEALTSADSLNQSEIPLETQTGLSKKKKVVTREMTRKWPLFRQKMSKKSLDNISKKKVAHSTQQTFIRHPKKRRKVPVRIRPFGPHFSPNLFSGLEAIIWELYDVNM
jgi:alpha-L-fucosidase